MLLVPGWAQTAATWWQQTAEFSRTHHVIAVDHRGHGLSEKPDRGYRIARLTRDLRDVILELGLERITWLGHSMGCSLAWSYWELYEGDRVETLVLADEPAAPVLHAHWPEGLAEHWGSTFTVARIAALVESLQGPHGSDTLADFVKGMITTGVATADREWLLDQVRQMPREYAAALLLDHALKDWRDILPCISVPTLVVGGTASLFPPSAAQATARAMPSATARIIGDRGSHLAYWESPIPFNREVREFLEHRSSDRS